MARQNSSLKKIWSWPRSSWNRLWMHEKLLALPASSNARPRQFLLETLEDRLTPVTLFDFADAPDIGAVTGTGNYQTLASDNGPSHHIVANLFLGNTVDGDDGTLQNVNANADDTNSALPDDEDGVLYPIDLIATEGTAPSVTVLVTNNTGSNATLSGWIDVNRDGVFDNATERAQAIVASGTTDGRVTLTFTTLPEDSFGDTYLRLRLSTDAAGANSTGAATDGEVEDYRFTIFKPGTGVADPAKTTKIAHGLNGGPTLGNNAYFGSSVASVGDLDGDGIGDVAVGSFGDSTGGGANRGAVYVLFLNNDGSVKSSTKIASNLNGGPTLANGDNFGIAVATLGDLDGDGVIELAVGASGDDTGNYNRGAVHVLFLNNNGTVKSSSKIASDLNGGPTLENGDAFGNSVASLGDLDGDGINDLAVGAPTDDTGGDRRGAVHVLFLNANGTVKSRSKIASVLNGGPTLANFDTFGASVASLGDLDGDGITDLAVGAYGDDTGGNFRGAVHVLLLNSDGTVKSTSKIASGLNGGPTLANFEAFGFSVVTLGDLDGDGVNDLAVGAYGDNTGGDYRGAVHLLLLNANGTVKSSSKIASDLNGGPTLADYDTFGVSVASLGDFDGDGINDLAVGATGDDSGGSGRGAVYVLFFSPPRDFGDAPDLDTGTGTGNYQTAALDNGPSHIIVDNLFLGASVDADDGTLQNTNADADDSNGSDDEDGVTGAITVTVGAATTTITVTGTNNTGSDAILKGWIDLDRNGIFDSYMESAMVVVTSTGAFSTSLVFDTQTATAGTTYLRLRLSTDSAAHQPDGAASDGEVEDYLVTVVADADTTPPKVESVIIDDGTGQMAVVRSITVLFDSKVNVQNGAFLVIGPNEALVTVAVTLDEVNGKTRAILTFSGALTEKGSLKDGNYTLRIDDALVSDLAGNIFDGDNNGIAGGDYVDDFFRLFGDSNGDGFVNAADLAALQTAYRTRVGDANYIAGFDWDNDGDIDAVDLYQLKKRLNQI